uniref:Uncharacterized protein n=1 Tax=Zea mays TaxID=4577 RepID=C0PM82_MAIZE|nr:unknown [Zea mays]
MTVILSLLPRSAASVANLFEHIPGSLTVSLIIDSTSWLLTTSHRPSLAITRNSSSADKAVSITSGCAVTAGLRSSSPIDLVT